MLEGERAAIEATFETIQQDRRHGDVPILAFELAVERQFPQWSMAFLGQSREGQDLFGHIGPATGFDTAHIEAQRMLNLIRAIAFENENNMA